VSDAPHEFCEPCRFGGVCSDAREFTCVARARLYDKGFATACKVAADQLERVGHLIGIEACVRALRRTERGLIDDWAAVSDSPEERSS
jgi:hypothetical protein